MKNTTNEIYNKLKELNDYEQIGKAYYDRTNKIIDFAQIIYLNTLLNKDIPEINLSDVRAKRMQEKIRDEFRRKYHATGLTEEEFFANHLPLQIEKVLRYVSIPEHKHDFYEFTYVFNGTCTHIINGTPHQHSAGTLTYIAPGNRHELLATKDCLCISFKIRRQYFSMQKLPNFPLFSYPFFIDCSDDNYVQELLLRIFMEQEGNHIYCTELIELRFKELMYYLMQNYRDQIQPIHSITSNDPIMIQVLDYMYENYKTITLASLAKHFKTTPSYMSTSIHKEFGKPYSVILKGFKLAIAADLLKTTDLKLDAICTEIGYNDTRQFIRSFKALYGITPHKYRVQNR